ncbi:hypothetical protein Acr_29g0009320 [Actinidia rufa]|uniref:Uncharacterized protein n=1 Tax=Actinidia rufa TaxID=165716 RepID=A0A7J0HF62_9ERIC|nr:hypothetical protein Acr_29g0009320 [Actinidia rufa]
MGSGLAKDDADESILASEAQDPNDLEYNMENIEDQEYNELATFWHSLKEDKRIRHKNKSVANKTEKKKPEKEEPKKEEPKKEEEAKKEEPKKEEEAKKEESKKEEPKKEEEKKKAEPALAGIMPYRPYYPPMNTYYYVHHSMDENPNACVIC